MIVPAVVDARRANLLLRTRRMVANKAPASHNYEECQPRDSKIVERRALQLLHRHVNQVYDQGNTAKEGG